MRSSGWRCLSKSAAPCTNSSSAAARNSVPRPSAYSAPPPTLQVGVRDVGTPAGQARRPSPAAHVVPTDHLAAVACAEPRVQQKAVFDQVVIAGKAWSFPIKTMVKWVLEVVLGGSTYQNARRCAGVLETVYQFVFRESLARRCLRNLSGVQNHSMIPVY